MAKSKDCYEAYECFNADCPYRKIHPAATNEVISRECCISVNCKYLHGTCETCFWNAECVSKSKD